jgi:acyl-CoA thioesterase-2
VADARPWARPLDQVLEIEALGEDRFGAVLDGFGGVTLGCAVLAAARTCPERALHSLHTYFLRPVPPGRRVALAIERVRDGRRLAHRRVRVEGDGRLLCELVACFGAAGAGAEYQDAAPDPGTPAPDALPSEDDVARAEGWRREDPGPLGGPLEWRWIGLPWREPAPASRSRYAAWVRPRFPLPDGDGALRAASLAFLCDYHSHLPAARRLGGPFEPVGYTSLDQALWVHRDVPWNDWWLLVSESDVAHAGRAFSRRLLHARDGRLIASMAQEQLLPAGRAGTTGPETRP